MTELAIHAVQPLAALDRRGISRRPYRVILTALWRCSPATTATTTAWRGLRVRRGSDQYQQRTARRRTHPAARAARSAFNVARHTSTHKLSALSYQLSAFGFQLSAFSRSGLKDDG
jgi:hypothetical protein